MQDLVKVRAANDKALLGGPQFLAGGKDVLHSLSIQTSCFPPGNAFGGQTNNW